MAVLEKELLLKSQDHHDVQMALPCTSFPGTGL